MHTKILIALAMISTAAHAGPAWTGYRGDEGTCVAPASQPPTEWNEKTGQNMRWKVPLANWGSGMPTVVKGRVFVVSEPGWKHDWPLLQCFNADTGKLLWERELNHLKSTALPADEQEKVAGAWKKFHAVYRAYQKAAFLWNQHTDEGRAEAAKVLAPFNLAINCAPDKDIREYGIGVLKGTNNAEIAVLKEAAKTMAKGGLAGETWRHGLGGGLMCVGHAYPTPVSDGQRLYCVTGLNGFFCFDLDGKELWQAHVPGANNDEFCSRARSPILYRDLLISDVDGAVRALDKATGQVRWQHPLAGRGHTTIVSPVVITSGGKDILLCGGKEQGGNADSSALSFHAFLLPDGKPLAVEGWITPGATMAVRTDKPDTVFFTGGGQHGGWREKTAKPTDPPLPLTPAGVRFVLEGETLKATVLWHGIDGKSAASHTGITYHQGRLYHISGRILNADTGQVLAARTNNVAVLPQSRQLLWIAGAKVYGLRTAGRGETGDAIAEVYSLDGKLLATNYLTGAPVEGEKLEQIISQDSTRIPGLKVARWRTWADGCPFIISGDRIYIRSADYLYCIGAK